MKGESARFDVHTPVGNDGKLGGVSGNGHRCQAHGGATSGFCAANQRFPDDGLKVVVLSNSGEEGVANSVAQTVAKIYLPANN